MEGDEVKNVVREGYSKIAGSGCCCSGYACDSDKKNEEISRSIGYSEEEMRSFGDSNLGLGCGNPVAMAAINRNERPKTIISPSCPGIVGSFSLTREQHRGSLAPSLVSTSLSSP